MIDSDYHPFGLIPLDAPIYGDWYMGWSVESRNRLRARCQHKDTTRVHDTFMEKHGAGYYDRCDCCGTKFHVAGSLQEYIQKRASAGLSEPPEK